MCERTRGHEKVSDDGRCSRSVFVGHTPTMYAMKYGHNVCAGTPYTHIRSADTPPKHFELPVL